jgi:dihydropteroate synthase
MGIVNATPDSFSDGGCYVDPAEALRRCEALVREGADLLDIGAQSSRPGALAVDAQEEWRRLQPLLSELISWSIPLSVDTDKPEIMRQALDQGVDIINDIHALRVPGSLAVVAAHSTCGVCLMHMHGEPQGMQQHPMAISSGLATTQEVALFLKERCWEAQAQSIAPNRLVIDPGVGFGKTVAQNFALLAHQSVLLDLGFPLLVGWSRKSSLGQVTGLAVQDRLVPSIAAAVLAVERGAHMVRVHDVAATVAALSIFRHGTLREANPFDDV